MSRDDRFCPLCDVTLDLHDGPDTCSAAQAQANVMDVFYGSYLSDESVG